MRLRAVVLFPLAVGLLLLGAPMGGALAYPPTTCAATIAISTTHPGAGESITVTGHGFDSRATVRLVLDTGDRLATVRTSAGGSFSAQVTMPVAGGHHVIRADGGTSKQSAGCPTSPDVDVAVAAGAAAAAAGPSGGGGTAVTGLDVLGLLAIAAALVGVGVVLNRRAGRRRGRSPS